MSSRLQHRSRFAGKMAFFMSWIFVSALLGCGAGTPPATAPPAQDAAPASDKAESAPIAAAAQTTPAPNDAAPDAAKPAAQEPVRTPATVAEAKAAFDLETFPLYEGAENPGPRRLGDLTYHARGKVADIYAFQREKLLGLGFKELPDSSVAEEYASGTFARDGYRVSVSVSNTGAADGEERINVYLFNHGNVDPSRLPVPEDCKPFYSGPANALFLTEKPVDETVAAIGKLLKDQGWVPYGSAGDTHYYRQNAIRLNATIGSAPAQGGKTMISFSSEQMSAELPGPPEMTDAQYSDATKTLMFDINQSEQELAQYYRETSTPLGWTATTDNPIEIDWKKVLIFRNEAKDLMELETSVVDGKTRAELKYQTAAEVAEIDRQVKAEQERRRKEMEEEASRPKPTVAIAIPRGAENIEVATNEISFQVGAKKAKEAFDAIRKQLTDDGWEEEQLTQDANLGHASFKKGDSSLTVTFVETGILPSELTITGFGVEVTRAE